MSLGASLFLIAVGAILRYAITESISGIDLQTVGLILMIVGIIGLLLSVVWMIVSANRDRAVVRDVRDPRDPRDPYYRP
jgi:hypothetical protein